MDHPILCPLENVHPPSDFGHASNWNFRDEYEFQKSFLLFQLFQGCRWPEPPYFKEFRMDYWQSNLKCMILETCRFECFLFGWWIFPTQFRRNFLSIKKIKNLSRNFYKLMNYVVRKIFHDIVYIVKRWCGYGWYDAFIFLF